MTHTAYQGHLPNSPVQVHSAGGLFPFVLFAKQVGDRLMYGFINPYTGKEPLIGSYDDTVACVEFLIRGRAAAKAANHRAVKRSTPVTCHECLPGHNDWNR